MGDITTQDLAQAKKRKTCEHCQYPMKTCVCSAREYIDNKTRIIILQDKNEVKNAKNTARLLALSLKNITIIRADDTERMADLAATCIATSKNASNAIALFFPSTNSKAFESQFPPSTGPRASDTAIKQVLFIDATWRKAKRLYLSHDFLQELPSYHFEQAQQGQYRIRKTSIDNGLSTLEASAYVLAHIENVNVEPLYALFNKMQSFWPLRQSNRDE